MFSSEQKTFPQETQLCGNNANVIFRARSLFRSETQASFSSQANNADPSGSFCPFASIILQIKTLGQASLTLVTLGAELNPGAPVLQRELIAGAQEGVSWGR